MSIDAYQGSDDSRDLADQGPQFTKEPLLRSQLNSDPITQFRKWYEEAEKAVRYPNQVSIGTVSKSGQPVVRTVLLKGFDQQGFRFYTNYQSRKAIHLEANPKISMCLYWEELERQVIILGSVVKLPEQESNEYFATRGKGSQIGAHVSSQSQVVKNRAELKSHFAELELQYKDKNVPRPAHWGGYCIVPDSIEFWQGQPDRVHDRFIYRIQTDKHWVIERLAP